MIESYIHVYYTQLEIINIHVVNWLVAGQEPINGYPISLNKLKS